MNTQRTTPCPECGEQWASEGSHYRICEVCREDYEPMRLALLSQVALHHSGTSKNCTCLGDETLKEYGDKKKEKQ